MASLHSNGRRPSSTRCRRRLLLITPGLRSIAFSSFVFAAKSGAATLSKWDIHVIDRGGSHPYITSYNSKPVIKNVTRRPHSKLAHPYTAFARVLSFLLLGFIVYGTTVEAAHKHGNLIRPNEVSGTASVSNRGSGTTLSTTVSGCNDCLICQLHQQFSTTLTSSPPSIDQSVSNSFFSSSALVSAGSRTTAPSTGRGPPYAS